MLEISEKTQGELAQLVRLVEDPRTPWGLAWHALSQLARKGQFQLDWARYQTAPQCSAWNRVAVQGVVKRRYRP